jgi:hypothetical protein
VLDKTLFVMENCLYIHLTIGSIILNEFVCADTGITHF